MKTNIRPSILCQLAYTFVVALGLVSCSEGDEWERPEDMSPYVPDYIIGKSGTWPGSGPTAYFDVKPTIYADLDFWQLEIIAVEYYIDGELIKACTTPPYAFTYTATNLPTGQHQFVMQVRLKDLVSDKEITIRPATEEFLVWRV